MASPQLDMFISVGRNIIMGSLVAAAFLSPPERPCPTVSQAMGPILNSLVDLHDVTRHRLQAAAAERAAVFRNESLRNRVRDQMLANALLDADLF